MDVEKTNMKSRSFNNDVGVWDENLLGLSMMGQGYGYID